MWFIHIRYRGFRVYLWQGRFASFPMDEKYLLKAAAYAELDPVKAKMVAKAEDYHGAVFMHTSRVKTRLALWMQGNY